MRGTVAKRLRRQAITRARAAGVKSECHTRRMPVESAYRLRVASKGWLPDGATAGWQGWKIAYRRMKRAWTRGGVMP